MSVGVRLIVGERHHQTRWEARVAPYSLTIPDRGLFTGIAIIGAVGSGKNSRPQVSVRASTAHVPLGSYRQGMRASSLK